MGYTDRFRAQHEDILRAAGEIQNLLNGHQPDPSALRKLLSILAGKVSVHLAMEDQALYPRLAELDGAVARRATKFKDEMGGLGRVFTEYNTRWQVSAIRADLAGFAHETRKIFGALAKRIERENAELYPLADNFRF
jgi:hypothetical protein